MSLGWREPNKQQQKANKKCRLRMYKFYCYFKTKNEWNKPTLERNKVESWFSSKHTHTLTRNWILIKRNYEKLWFSGKEYEYLYYNWARTSNTHT